MIRLICLLLFLPLVCRPNGLDIGELALPEEATLQAMVSWENSWHYADTTAPGNHDAIWIFCKGLSRSSGNWEHIYLLPGAGTSQLEMEITVSNDGVGAMLRRSSFGEGNISDLEVNIPLEDFNQEDYYELKLFGIEMVYINPGPFFAGDSASTNTLINYSDKLPYGVENEDEILVGEFQGGLWSSSEFPPEGDIPAGWPKGFDGFYCMKYEISQVQYADFLNTLGPLQVEANRLSTIIEAPCFAGDHIEGERNYIIDIDGRFGCDANGNRILNEEDDGTAIACNFLTWSNLTAYLDWAGLRPMTELEYEKACRGPLEPLPLEFAWGTDLHINTLQLTDLALPTEHAAGTIPPGTGIANSGYCIPSGPMRCGFAGWNSQSRAASGASYYGVMEMSGNLWELCVPMDELGLMFNGRHGDGMLGGDGKADVANWLSGGHRGGAWNSGILEGFRDLAISDRFFIYLDPEAQSRGTAGGRGVISQSRIP